MDKDLRKFSGYAHLYENHYITPWGNERQEYKLGNPSETIEGLPDAHEYDGRDEFRMDLLLYDLKAYFKTNKNNEVL